LNQQKQVSKKASPSVAEGNITRKETRSIIINTNVITGEELFEFDEDLLLRKEEPQHANYSSNISGSHEDEDLPDESIPNLIIVTQVAWALVGVTMLRSNLEQI